MQKEETWYTQPKQLLFCNCAGTSGKMACIWVYLGLTFVLRSRAVCLDLGRWGFICWVHCLVIFSKDLTLLRCGSWNWYLHKHEALWRPRSRTTAGVLTSTGIRCSSFRGRWRRYSAATMMRWLRPPLLQCSPWPYPLLTKGHNG